MTVIPREGVESHPGVLDQQLQATVIPREGVESSWVAAFEWARDTIIAVIPREGVESSRIAIIVSVVGTPFVIPREGVERSRSSRSFSTERGIL